MLMLDGYEVRIRELATHRKGVTKYIINWENKWHRVYTYESGRFYIRLRDRKVMLLDREVREGRQ